jgi:hypothetical protein
MGLFNRIEPSNYIVLELCVDQVLKAIPFPYTITTFHFASGSFFITLMWLLNLHPKPRLSLKQVLYEIEEEDYSLLL